MTRMGSTPAGIAPAHTFIRKSLAAVGVMSLLLAGAGAANAESTQGAAPKAADVATLRQLLALQYPALRAGGASAETIAPMPAVTVEPERRDGKPQVEGGASNEPPPDQDAI